MVGWGEFVQLYFLTSFSLNIELLFKNVLNKTTMDAVVTVMTASLKKKQGTP